MPATHALIELLGDVALLLWGVHMVRTGILRAFGGDLRQLGMSRPMLQMGRRC
jgi:phosphate:Na+ symporter